MLYMIYDVCFKLIKVLNIPTKDVENPGPAQSVGYPGWQWHGHNRSKVGPWSE